MVSRNWLTASELAVVDAVARGLTYREIAFLRQRSVHTIANQLASAYRKLGVSSRREVQADAKSGDGPISGERERAREEALSRRERQVIELARAGCSNKEIAYSLEIGLSSVATYLGRARRKLDQTELVVPRSRALRTQASEPEPPAVLAR